MPKNFGYFERKKWNYGKNLVTMRLSRNRLPQKAMFMSFLKFRDMYF